MKIYFTLKDGFVKSYNFLPTFEYTNEKEINQKEEELFLRHFPFIKYVSGEFVFDKSKEEKVIEKQKLIFEQQEILKWFQDNDWIINKAFLGEWTKEDPRWLLYLQERQFKRNRLDNLEFQISMLE
jgi:hypothetical protein